ncbi:hypothetical protein Tco_0487847 [Tanacetum coccineum]
MFDEYFPPLPKVVSRVLPAVALVNDNTTSTPFSTSINQDALSASTSPTSTETQSLVIYQEPSSQKSSSNVKLANPPFEHISKWMKNHPLENVIGNPSRLVSTRRQLQTDAMWGFFDAFLTSVEPKNFKEALL